MTDSSSFTSLLALVDSHLSKCSVAEGEASRQCTLPRSIPAPSQSNNSKMTTMSDTRLLSPGHRLPIPSLSVSESPITNILAEQISNMFKAKELKRQQEEEQKKIAEEMERIKLEENNCLIDLMQAVQRPSNKVDIPMQRVHSNSSSMESLLFDRPEFYRQEEDEQMNPISIPVLLPCKNDMSYILMEKSGSTGRCSSFGRIITARIHPVVLPYLRDRVESKVSRFKFSVKSPCDVIKEKLKKPTCHTANNGDLIAEFLAS